MGWLLIISIAAMTSFMTMVQLIALTLTTAKMPASQAKTAEIAKAFPAKGAMSKTGKTAPRNSAKHRTRRVRRRNQAVSSQQQT